MYMNTHKTRPYELTTLTPPSKPLSKVPRPLPPAKTCAFSTDAPPEREEAEEGGMEEWRIGMTEKWIEENVTGGETNSQHAWKSEHAVESRHESNGVHCMFTTAKQAAGYVYIHVHVHCIVHVYMYK